MVGNLFKMISCAERAPPLWKIFFDELLDVGELSSLYCLSMKVSTGEPQYNYT